MATIVKDGVVTLQFVHVIEFDEQMVKDPLNIGKLTEDAVKCFKEGVEKRLNKFWLTGE